MGSSVRLTVLGAGPRAARAARDAAWEELLAADAELSRFRADSELSRANALAGSGVPIRPGRRLRVLLAMADRAQRTTAGRFDARVIRALESIGERAGVPLPDVSPAGDRWLAAARPRGSFRLRAPIDSGGLGKGLALRWALGAARRAAPDAAGLLLVAGGDLATDGCGPGGGGWSVGVEDPLQRGRLLAVIRLLSGAVATSSTSVRSWAYEGEAVHHLIDPTTGRPARTGLLAVTVHGADPAWAEVATKSLFLAGATRIGDEARAGGLAAWWVEEDGSLHMTPGAREMTTWTAPLPAPDDVRGSGAASRLRGRPGRSAGHAPAPFPR
jgi:thiamine biosynthesis lipoprotein